MNIVSNKKKLIVIISGIGLGLIAGFAYWKFVGCQSGTCPLTSKWYMSTLFGGVFGYLLSDSIKLDKKKEKEYSDTSEN